MPQAISRTSARGAQKRQQDAVAIAIQLGGEGLQARREAFQVAIAGACPDTSVASSACACGRPTPGFKRPTTFQ